MLAHFIQGQPFSSVECTEERQSERGRDRDRERERERETGDMSGSWTHCSWEELHLSQVLVTTQMICRYYWNLGNKRQNRGPVNISTCNPLFTGCRPAKMSSINHVFFFFFLEKHIPHTVNARWQLRTIKSRLKADLVIAVPQSIQAGYSDGVTCYVKSRHSRPEGW